MTKEKRKYKTNSVHDKYYTKVDVARKCIISILSKISDIDVFIEPSAGNGSFSRQIDGYCIAIDKYPAHPSIVEMDFFAFHPEGANLNGEKVCCFGNPPFGRNASIAVRFFNHAAEFSTYIAFILPRTFRKISVQNRLHKSFHLIHDEDIPKRSFIYEGEEIDVPCAFQIWERREVEREIVKLKITTDLFDFATKEDCDFAVRRVGGSTGRVFVNISEMSEQSNYFIKSKELETDELVSIINSIDFSKIINNTAGVRSLSKRELIRLVEERYDF